MAWPPRSPAVADQYAARLATTALMMDTVAISSEMTMAAPLGTLDDVVVSLMGAAIDRGAGARGGRVGSLGPEGVWESSIEGPAPTWTAARGDGGLRRPYTAVLPQRGRDQIGGSPARRGG